MPPEKRSELIAVRLTETEVKLLTELAEVDGLYQSDVVRLLIRKGHADRFGKVVFDGSKRRKKR